MCYLRDGSSCLQFSKMLLATGQDCHCQGTSLVRIHYPIQDSHEPLPRNEYQNFKDQEVTPYRTIPELQSSGRVDTFPATSQDSPLIRIHYPIQDSCSHCQGMNTRTSKIRMFTRTSKIGTGAPPDRIHYRSGSLPHTGLS